MNYQGLSRGRPETAYDIPSATAGSKLLGGYHAEFCAKSYQPRKDQLTRHTVSASLERVLSALEALDCRPKGSPERGYMALCPAHADVNPSLSVNHRNERALVYCHAGCTIQALLDALALSRAELFDDWTEG